VRSAIRTEEVYFRHEHVVVSYKGDLGGVVEDVLGKQNALKLTRPATTVAYQPAECGADRAAMIRAPSIIIVEADRHIRTPCMEPVLDGSRVVTQARARGRSVSA
jgi:hypothetical protein